MFLMIENEGVAPVQSFTVLGLSTARGQASKIGQFGSGSKHGILTCMRQGITPTILLGDEPLKFATTTDRMGDKEFKQLTYEFRGEIKELPISLEFGELDWDGLEMGLREFVSNAIDAGGHNVEVTAKIEPMAGKTRVFLPFTAGVSKFFGDIREKFLHFSPEYDAKQTILVKAAADPAMFYRKGVFIRKAAISLFNYNFDDTIKIDECRNMNEYTVKEHAAKLWKYAPQEQVESLLRQFDKISDKVFEGNIYYPAFYSWMGENDKQGIKNWKAAFKAVFGDKYIADPKTQGQLIAKAEKKGHSVVQVPSAFMPILMSAGIQTVNSSLGNVDSEGREVKDAGPILVAKVAKIWAKLEEKGFTNGKQMPKVKTFIHLQDGENMVLGYYKENTIYIESNQTSNSMCILEELGHHITGSEDFTRDFQSYFVKLCANLLRV